MTIDQLRELSRSRRYSGSLAVVAPSVCREFEPHPTPEDRLAHQEQIRPLESRDCNGLSIRDSQTFHDYRYSDPLAKCDKIAAVYHRALYLRESLEKMGTQRFKQAYENAKK